MKFAVSYNTGLNHKEFDTMPEARRFAKKNKGSVAVVRTNSEGAKVLDWLNDKDQIVYTSKF